MSARRLQNYVGGQWREPEVSGWLPVRNPATGELLAEAPLSTPAEAGRAAEAAAAAFPAWAATPVYRRCLPLLTLARLVRDREETLARVLVAEMGKSLPDARAEIKRMVENCEVAAGMPILSQGDKVVGCSLDMDGEVLRLPVGVFAMIAPFNFPAMIPFWFAPYALAAGNTYVVKSSSLVPMSMALIAEWMHEAGFPPGTFNLVNGTREAASALVEHPAVAGVSIVGQSATARAVSLRCAGLGKRCLAMGSAKNHLVVMPDAHLDGVVRNMTTSCYGCAGQRCMAASVVVAVGGDMYRRLTARFVEDSKKVIVADPLDPRHADEPMLMGPVISREALERVLGLVRTGIEEGATLALDGRGVSVKGCEKGHFIGPTVFTGVRPGMAIYETEIFGPVVCMMQAESLDEAIGLVSSHRYGNGASIYTQNGYWARRFKLEARAGMIGVNVGIPAPVAYLPFGGMRDSMHGDIKAQGRAVVDFFTERKIVTERYFEE
jgi:malonate-semialdehyde dehydrogenase (acetylating)/methylmalonate-semialdehyde dehydrogenase